MSRPYQSRGRGFGHPQGRGGGGGYSQGRGGGGGGHWRGAQQQPKLDRIDYGTSGLIFTMEVLDERQAVREAMNLIDEFLPKLQSSGGEASAPKINAEGEEKDVSDVLKEMCEQTKKGVAPGQHRVKQLDIGAKHTIFFSVDSLTPDDYYSTVDMMAEECQKGPRCRFLSRCIPVEDVCSAAGESSLSIPIGGLVQRHVQLYSSGAGEGASPPTYAVEYKVRNSSSPIDREVIYKLVAAEMEKHAPGSRVNLTEPDLHILVNVYRAVAMLSCVRRYLQRRSFSLRPPVEKKEGEEKGNPGGGDKQSDECDDADVKKVPDEKMDGVNAVEDEMPK